MRMSDWSSDVCSSDLTLLAFRALQGLSAGVGLIVGRALIRDVLHGDDAQRLMSQVSMIFGVAPAIAPIIGGWILGWGHWTAIFWFLVGFALLLRSEEHPSELQSLMRISYAVFCLKTKKNKK